MPYIVSKNKKDRNKIVKFKWGKYSGGRTACLIYYRGFTNITMTLIDMNSKVITHKTSGQSQVGYSSRAKKSPQAIEKIIFKLTSTFKKYNLVALHIIIKRRVSWFLTQCILKALETNEIKCLSLRRKIRLPHNGVRKGKKPSK